MKVIIELTEKEAKAIVHVIGEVADHDEVLRNVMNFDKREIAAAKRAYNKISQAAYKPKS